MKNVYVCTGGCGGKVDEEKHQSGVTSCGTEGCANHKKQFENRLECEECGELFKEGEEHGHGD